MKNDKHSQDTKQYYVKDLKKENNQNLFYAKKQIQTNNPDYLTGYIYPYYPLCDNNFNNILDPQFLNPSKWYLQSHHFYALDIIQTEDQQILEKLLEIEQILTNKTSNLFYFPNNHQYWPQSNQKQTYEDTPLPLYQITDLGIQKKDQKRLTNLLNKVAAETKDFHEVSPVQDIIDPDLMPNYSEYVENQQKENYIIQTEKEKESYKDHQKIMQLFNGPLEDTVTFSPQTEQNNQFVKLRSQYQWIPTKFNITPQGDIKIIGNIHNLPKKGNEELYDLIKEVFVKMVPYFKHLNVFNHFLEQDLTIQVVVKVQKYIIPPGMKYTGKWHLEGKTENIIGVGNYYCQIDPGFPKDQLLFRTLQQSMEFEDQRELDEVLIEVKEGYSFVFLNELPHKFDTLTNSTNKTLERIFLNFFIVDPKKPLKDTQYVEQQYTFLEKGMDLSEIDAKVEMQKKGFEFDIQKGKQKRKLVREAADDDISGWGFTYYGNQGETQYIDTFSYNINEEQEFSDIILDKKGK